MENIVSRDKRILIKYNRFPHLIGAFPPFYCTKSHKFVVSKTGALLYLFPLVFLTISIDLTYLWIKISPKITPQAVGPQEFTNFYGHVISRSCACTLGWIFYFRMNDLMHFLNIMFKMEEHFEG